MTSEEPSSSRSLIFTQTGLCGPPCAVSLTLPDAALDQLCQQLCYDLLQTREMPCENETVQIATSLESE